jgi:hypothetical protein
MAKITKKRGRPAIKPYIEKLIASRVFDEQKKPQEARMPPKVLAGKIQKEIKEHIKQGDRVPALDTLKKRIETYNRTSDSLDKPWSAPSLVEYPIPAEALPFVLQVWIHNREASGEWLTIREAQWVARFYCVLKDIEALIGCSKAAAYMERLHEQIGVPHTFAYHSTSLSLLEMMTGQKIPLERVQQILGLSDEQFVIWKQIDELNELPLSVFDAADAFDFTTEVVKRFAKKRTKKGGKE